MLSKNMDAKKTYILYNVTKVLYLYSISVNTKQTI